MDIFCDYCGTTKTEDAFMPSDIKRGNIPLKDRGYYGRVWCRACRYEYKRTYVALRDPEPPNAEAVYLAKIRRSYGLSEDQYRTMLLNQQYVCLLCQKPNTGGRRLCVDHDHDTGRVRGLLCFRCNGFVGRYDIIYRGRGADAASAQLYKEAGDDEVKKRIVAFMDEAYALRVGRGKRGGEQGYAW